MDRTRATIEPQVMSDSPTRGGDTSSSEGLSGAGANPFETKPSMFDRLRTNHPQRRELGWEEFRARYAPIIAGFARNLGARPQDIDDIIQDVFLGFFSVSNTFEYNPAKGRFRGYLKTVTMNSIRRRFDKQFRLNEVPLSELADDSLPVEQSWDRAWAEQILRQAIERVRAEQSDRKTFEAFERYAVLKQPAADVAAALDMSIDSVYAAKHRMLGLLRTKVRELEEED